MKSAAMQRRPSSSGEAPVWRDEVLAALDRLRICAEILRDHDSDHALRTAEAIELLLQPASDLTIEQAFNLAGGPGFSWRMVLRLAARDEQLRAIRQTYFPAESEAVAARKIQIEFDRAQRSKPPPAGERAGSLRAMIRAALALDDASSISTIRRALVGES